MDRYNTLAEWEKDYFPKALERKLEQAGYQDAKLVATASINRLTKQQVKQSTNKQLHKVG